MPADLIKEKAFSLDHLISCKGYDPSFISKTADIHYNILKPVHKKKLPEVKGNPNGILHYTRYSVMFHKGRKVPFFSVSNIDGALKKDQKKDKITRPSGFKPDPRVDEKFQLSDAFYDLVKNVTEFEIGHMTSNDELCWGKTVDDARLFSYETFHFTNSVPQAERLNSGLWRSLEQYILDEIKDTDSQKVCVFTGPVISTRDPLYKNDESFKVPLLFWKVIVYQYKKKLRAAAFMMSHEKKLLQMGLLKTKPVIKGVTKKAAAKNLPPFEDYHHKKIFQVNVSLIEKLTGFELSWDKVTRVEVPEAGNPLEEISKVASASDIKSKGLKRKAATKQKKKKLNLVLE